MNTDQFDSFVEDLLDEKVERSIVIIGVSKIDDLLLSILSKHLIAKNSGKTDDLLEGDHPIGTLSARIKLTYRLGIIDGSLFQVLEQVRKIRNLSAHQIEFSIKKSPVKDHFSELRKHIFPRSTFKLSKTRFFNDILDTQIKELQCILISICVILQAIYEIIALTPGIESTLSISKK